MGPLKEYQQTVGLGALPSLTSIRNETADLFFYFSHQDVSGALVIIERDTQNMNVWEEVFDGLERLVSSGQGAGTIPFYVTLNEMITFSTLTFNRHSNIRSYKSYTFDGQTSADMKP